MILAKSSLLLCSPELHNFGGGALSPSLYLGVYPQNTVFLTVTQTFLQPNQSKTFYTVYTLRNITKTGYDGGIGVVVKGCLQCVYYMYM